MRNSFFPAEPGCGSYFPSYCFCYFLVPQMDTFWEFIIFPPSLCGSVPIFIINEKIHRVLFIFDLSKKNGSRIKQRKFVAEKYRNLESKEEQLRCFLHQQKLYETELVVDRVKFLLQTIASLYSFHRLIITHAYDSSFCIFLSSKKIGRF